VIEHFIAEDESILFEILLHPGDVAVLVAASSGFIVESVELVNVKIETTNGVKALKIPQVKLSYLISWSDFDIDERPQRILV
jgi:hypothetical protein